MYRVLRASSFFTDKRIGFTVINIGLLHRILVVRGLNKPFVVSYYLPTVQNKLHCFGLKCSYLIKDPRYN